MAKLGNSLKKIKLPNLDSEDMDANKLSKDATKPGSKLKSFMKKAGPKRAAYLA